VTSKARDLVKRLGRLGVPTNLRRHPNTVVALGDSRAAQIHADGIFKNKSGYNHFSMGNALAGNRAILLRNFGNSGDRSDQILTRLKPAIDTGAYVLYIIAGVNDIAQNYPTATTSGVTAFANIKLMIDAGVDNGMLPLVVLEPGANNMTPAQIGQLIILQELLREYAETCPHIVLFDLPAAIYNMAATSTSALALLGTIDGVHEGSLGGYLGGKAFAQILMAIMPPRPHGFRSAVETQSISPFNLTVNPMFTGLDTGTVGTGLTGKIATGFVGSRSGGGTAVASVAASSDGSGLWEQVLQCTFAAAGDEVNVHQDIPTNLWNAGDILQSHAEVVVDAGSVNLCNAYLYLQANGTIGGTQVATTSMDGYVNGTQHGATTTEGFRLNYSTEKLIVPNYDVKSWVTAHVKVVGAGVGSATVRVRRFGVRKRFA
jgi:lysophospholipase L1-like esterase